SRLYVMEIERGVSLELERIPHTRAASLAWLPDDSGFYYTRYPEPGSVAEGEEMYHRHVYFHPLELRPTSRLSPQDAVGRTSDDSLDAEVFGAGRAREDWPNVDLSL